MSENTKKRLNMAFKIYLLVAPLLFCLSNSGAPFELIKLLALVTFALLAASIVAINTVQSGEIQIRWNPALTISAGLLLVNFISYVFSIDRYLSFWGDDQIPADSLLSVFAIFALCFSVVQIQPTRKDILAFLKVIVLTTSLMAAHGLLQYFGIARFQELHIFGNTMVSTIGQAVIYCNVLVCAVPLFIFLYTSEKNTAVKTLLAVGFLLTEAALFLSESRTPWLINLTVLLLYVLNLLRRLKHSHHKKLIGGAVFLFAILAIWQLQAPLNTRLNDKLSSAALQKGLEARVLVWKDGLASLQDHLLIGSGPETFGIEQKKYQSIELNMNEYWKSYWAKAHNAVIQLTVTTGLLGLLAYLSIYIYLAFRLFKCFRTQSVNTDLLCAIAFPVFLIFLCNLTSFNYLVTQTYTSFLFVLFVLIDTPKTEIIKTRATPVYRFALWTLVVVQLGLVASTFTYWYSDILLQESYRQMKAQNEPDAALELAGRALAFNSSNPFVYCHRSNVLLDVLLKSHNQLPATQIENILQDIDHESQTCIDLAPNRYQAYLSRGRTFSILFQRGFVTDSSTAEASFLEFHRLAPRNPGPYFENAMLDLRNRKTDGFIEKMQTVISLKADFLPAHVELIKYYIKTNDGEKIDPLVARILTTDFRSAEFLPEIKAVAALCQNNGKQNLADQLENLYEQKKYLLMKTY